MTDSSDDRKHFTKAVAQLGERQDVVASQAIFNSQGVKIIDKGAAINLGLYDRLMQHKLATPLEESLMSVNSVNGESLKQTVESMLQDIPLLGRLVAEPAARKLLLNAIATVPLPEAMAFQLTVARDVRPQIYMHLVRAALVAVWLVHKPPMVSRFDLGMAAAAGLLHDIGMLHVDPVLLQPGLPLNREQRRQLYSHPLLSTALVERHHQYGREVIRAVAEHQEHLDGSGYPGNLMGEAISELGRVVGLAQVVAAVLAPSRNAPEMQLSVLLRMNSHRYDRAMATQVLAQVQPQLDVLSAGVMLLDDPIACLAEIEAILGQLPLELGSGPELTKTRSDGLALVAEHGANLRRALASVGALSDQLAQLGEEAQDETVRTELSLLCREAGWQLRTLGREARRRWRGQIDEAFPAPMQQWLERIDALVEQVAEARSDDAAEAALAQMGDDDSLFAGDPVKTTEESTEPVPADAGTAQPETDGNASAPSASAEQEETPPGLDAADPESKPEPPSN